MIPCLGFGLEIGTTEKQNTGLGFGFLGDDSITDTVLGPAVLGAAQPHGRLRASTTQFSRTRQTRSYGCGGAVRTSVRAPSVAERLCEKPVVRVPPGERCSSVLRITNNRVTCLGGPWLGGVVREDDSFSHQAHVRPVNS